jgi:hypothetical protein
MGSSIFNIISMNQTIRLREQATTNPTTEKNISERDSVMDKYKSVFGSNALRELYDAHRHNVTETINAAIEALNHRSAVS